MSLDRVIPSPRSRSSSELLDEDLRSRSGDVSSPVNENKVIESTGLVGIDWYPWHTRTLRAIGPDRYLRLADMAKQSKQGHPERLFSWLLKRELTYVKSP